ncbi:The fantastic four family [Heracleum sosnowskyi]|uniref:The fantastic four family n=1 Tax=Heracleum sosnowskyi TaxID=360622 RepID=A0AAD8LZ35_9APIA|nr:The fantastic four family [Heracleum sosnowskyi]
MASCGSLQHIFEKPLSENSSNLLQSFTSWKHLPPLEVSSVTEFFGELHFKEHTEHVTPIPHSAPSSSSFSFDFYSQPKSEILNEEKNEKIYTPTIDRKQYKTTSSYSSMNSESLSICTEGLGFESCKDTEDFVNNSGSRHRKARTSVTKHSSSEYLSGMRSRITGGELPPPISRIGRTGKPAVSFTSYRENGRFVLKEVKLPIKESLHACREDGRLKLQYIQSDDIIQENKEKEESIEGVEDWEDQNACNLVNGSGEAGKGINGGEIVEDEDEGVVKFQ